VTDSSPSAAPDRWKPVPGDDAVVSKGFQFFHSVQARTALPAAIRSQVLDAVVPAGESVVASLSASRVYVSESGSTRKFGLGDGNWPYLAATQSRLVLFVEFVSGPARGKVVMTGFGVEKDRQYLELPLDGEVSISPYSRNRFTLTWSGGLSLEVLPGPPAAPFYRRGPLKAFYTTVSGLLRSRGADPQAES
jgi:hypothetical protein